MVQGKPPVTGGAKLTCAQTDNAASVLPDGLRSTDACVYVLRDVLVKHTCRCVHGDALHLASHEAHGKSHAFQLPHAEPCFSSYPCSGSLVLKAYLWSAPYFLSLKCTSHTLYSAGQSSLQHCTIHYSLCLTALSYNRNPEASRNWERKKKKKSTFPGVPGDAVLGYKQTGRECSGVCIRGRAHNVLPCAIFSKH